MSLFRKRSRKTRNLSRRYTEIVGILVKYGFSEFARFSGLEKHAGLVKKVIPKRHHVNLSDYTPYEKIRLAMEELGPSFIKLGQIISSRRDMLPGELIDELEKLQDKVPPFPSEKAVQIVEQDLKQPLHKVFPAFDLTPIASASIAQVHKAVLPDGSIVAVKVRRPAIVDKVQADIQIMYRLARFIERHHHNPALRPLDLVREFELQINKEMSFTRELHNIRKFQQNFRGNPHIFVPDTYKDISTERVLVLQYVRGTKVLDIMNDRVTGFDRKVIASRGADLILRQIFIHGFFHADPHPGNLLVLEGNIICFLDFGMMGTVLPQHQDSLNSIMLGMVRRDARQITRAILQYTRAGETVKGDQLEMAIYNLMERYLDLPLEDVDFNQSLNSLLELIVKFKIDVPSNLTMMAKALMTIEGVGLQLDPDFKVIEHMEKFSINLIAHKYNVKHLTEEAFTTASDYISLVRELPNGIRSFAGLVKNRQLRMEFELTGMEPIRETVDKVGFRLVFGLVLSALLISSSLMVLADIRPKWNDIPIIGLVGFLIGGVMGVLFLISGVIRIIQTRSWRVKKNIKD